MLGIVLVVYIRIRFNSVQYYKSIPCYFHESKVYSISTLLEYSQYISILDLNIITASWLGKCREMGDYSCFHMLHNHRSIHFP